MERCCLRLLYISCHEVLEFDEVALFRELGIEVLTIGEDFTIGPSAARLRPSLSRFSLNGQDFAASKEFAACNVAPRVCLSSDFVDPFDIILLTTGPQWIVRHWETIRKKTVIWRTIGQSSPDQEFTMQSYRRDGLRIVRYSPAERRLANYAGEDALIRFYKDHVEWSGWTGKKPIVACFCQSMPRRAAACNYRTLLQLSKDMPFELYGPDNHDAGPIWSGCLSYDQMRAALRDSRACFYTGTFPASYTLGFIEAWMTGIPVVAIGNRLFSRVCTSLASLYEIPDLIEHEVNGFVSDDLDELRSCLQCLLANWDYARQISKAARAAAVRHFDKTIILDQWRRFFTSLSGQNRK
jgi:glycosyltransferase involved in cell wall biosynthesis